jgi:predicted nuclease of predicted toxin-antitoxin system
LLFLVDAQLPPSLAAALRDAGCDAVHVADLDLQGATDQQLWNEATSRSAVLVTKDRDFSLLRAARTDGPAILWVCQDASILHKAEKQILQDRLDLRNQCGHPNPLVIAEHTVAHHIELLMLNVYSRY